MAVDTTQNRPAGYAFLVEQYGLSAVPNWHTSSVSPTGTLRRDFQDGQMTSVYPQSYWPGDGTGDHLECYRPPIWSHFGIALMEPPRDRANGARSGSA